MSQNVVEHVYVTVNEFKFINIFTIRTSKHNPRHTLVTLSLSLSRYTFFKNHAFDNYAIHVPHPPFVRRGNVFQIAIDSDRVCFVPP
jgi:hypothetical protein